MQRYNLPTPSLSACSNQALHKLEGHLSPNPSERVINLSGNIKKNIQDLANMLACFQNCEAKQILCILADKIEKLRAERDSLKEKYVEDAFLMQRQIKMLERQNIEMARKLKTLGEAWMTGENSGEGEIGCEKIRMKVRDSYKESGNKKSYEECERDYKEIKRIVLKYNISEEELEHMLKEYLLVESGVLGVDQGEERRLKNLQFLLAKQREQKELKNSIQSIMKATKNK